MFLKRCGVMIGFLTVLLSLSDSALAQRRRLKGPELPQPFLQSVYPPGLQRGQSVEVTIRGAEINGTPKLWFDHPGLTAEHVKDLTYRIKTTPETPFGHHDVRISTPFGVSNARVLVVGDRPESNETEPNNQPEQATAIVLNTVKNGEIAAPTDVDWFSFEGRQGQRVFIEVEAERIDSQLDATARLVDAKGREIVESRDAEGADPFIDAVIPADGRYFIKVQDVIYGGSPHHGYRLTLTDSPRLDAIRPALANPGETRSYTLFGRNLGGEATGLTINGNPIERKVVQITAPRRTDEPTPGSLMVRSSAATRKGFEYTAESPSGRSKPVFIAWADDPIVAEKEVKSDTERIAVIEPPCVISGAFEVLNDLDTYRFKAKKGEAFWIEASAEEIGSAAEPVVVVQQVSDKGEVSDLLTLLDQADKGARLRFGTNTVDCSGRWTAPSDGTFQIQLSDLFGSQRGNVRLTYRLSIRRPRPDFTLVALPESPNLPDAIVIPVGGRALGYVLALRTDGFDGPIRVSAIDLPPGLRVEPVIISSGQNFAPIVFEANTDAPLAISNVRLIGRSRFADRKDSIDYVSGITPLDLDETHQSLGGAVVWPGGNPAVAGDQQGATSARLTRGFVVQTADLPSFRITSNNVRQSATPGGLLSVDFNLERRKGFDEAVAVTLISTLPNLPTPPTITIPKNETKAVYSFTLPNEVKPGLYSLVFQGSGTMPFSPDPKGEKKPVTLSEPSNPIELVVRAAPLKLTSNLKGGAIKAGGELEIELTANGTAGTFPIQLVGPTGLKLSAPETTITTGQVLKWTIKATADAPAGPTLGLGVRIVVDRGREGGEVIEPLALTITK